MARSALALELAPMSTALLSDKKIPARQRLILPLDVASYGEAMALVDKLGDAVEFYKVGLELIMAGDHVKVMDECVNRGKKVMLDAKIHDIDQTVRLATIQAGKHGATFLTLHAGSDALLKAALEVKQDIKILAVTLLTSISDSDIKAWGIPDLTAEKVVLSRAKRALALGCDGVISSGLEASALRQELGTRFIIVSPGIRPLSGVDDQQRTVNVEEAFAKGADYIIVGRPIRNTSDPKKAALDVQAKIAAIFPGT